MLCEHLAELEQALIAANIPITYRGQPWTSNCREWVYFACWLDRPAIRARSQLADCVHDHDHRVRTMARRLVWFAASVTTLSWAPICNIVENCPRSPEPGSVRRFLSYRRHTSREISPQARTTHGSQIADSQVQRNAAPDGRVSNSKHRQRPVVHRQQQRPAGDSQPPSMAAQARSPPECGSATRLERCGHDGFTSGVLDTLAPSDEPNYDPAEDLRALEDLWLAKLASSQGGLYNTLKSTAVRSTAKQSNAPS